MTSLVFNTCCGCIDLRTGCLIIGYLQLIGECIGVIYTSINLYNTDLLLALVGPGTDETIKEIKLILKVSLIVLGVLLAFIIVSLILAISLLFGVHKDRRGYIKAYLIYAVICLVATMILFILRHVVVPVVSFDTIYSIVYILSTVYFLLVVRSYYIKLGEAMNRAVYNTA